MAPSRVSTNALGIALRRGGACGLIALTFAAGSASGDINPGQLVVVRAGDGVSALGSGAAPLHLDVYDLSGPPPLAPVQTISFPTDVSGSNRRCTGQGSSGSSTFLTQSGDGRYLVLTGYNVAVGGSIASSTDRVIARIALDGSIDTTTTLGPTGSSGVYIGLTGGAIRGAATYDGSAFWTSGLSLAGTATTRGLHYTTLGSTTAPVQIHASATPGGGLIDSFQGQLFCSLSAGSTSQISSVGSGLPTSTSTMTPLLTTPTAQSLGEFFFADPNTIYIASSTAGTASTAGIEKWVFSGGVWSFAYRLLNGGPSGIRCSTLTGTVSGGQVTLYAVESGTNAMNGVAVHRVVDTGGGSLGTVLCTAPANSGFRGIRLIAPTGACCNEGTQACAITTYAGCAAGSTFAGDGVTCQASPCGGQPSGVCCRGSTCSTSIAQVDCVPSGTAGALFVTGGAPCGSGSTTAPCCLVDFNKSGNVSVQDIFDFLDGYFNASPFARVGGDGSGPAPTVQSIFDFLSAYFLGGC